MTNMGDSLKAFQDDLSALGLDGKVLTIIFSEFGRKIIQNASFGLDHGTLSSMFLIGTGIEGGVVGDNIDLSFQDNPGAADPAQLQHDYRQVLATLMQDWLGASDTSLNNTFLSPAFYADKPALVKPAEAVPSGCYYVPDEPIVCACIQVRVALEGFFNPATMNMHTQLADAGLLPLSQPYSYSPFNYSGNETVANFPENTVDWLLVELRNEADLNAVAARKAVLLRNDGLVMDEAGTPGLSFDGVPDGAYHLAVFHRSHLAILSSDRILTDAPGFIYDFTQSEYTVAGESQLKKVGMTWCMLAGDADGNNVIDNRDFNLWQQNEGQNSVYQAADFNADGVMDEQDYNLWFGNRSKLGNLK
jgi:hypothetical protein